MGFFSSGMSHVNLQSIAGNKDGDINFLRGLGIFRVIDERRTYIDTGHILGAAVEYIAIELKFVQLPENLQTHVSEYAGT